MKVGWLTSEFWLTHATAGTAGWALADFLTRPREPIQCLATAAVVLFVTYSAGAVIQQYVGGRQRLKERFDPPEDADDRGPIGFGAINDSRDDEDEEAIQEAPRA